jgi:tripeptide aminopeptidase
MKAYERLLQYVKIDTTSNENEEACPSSPNQKVLGKKLVDEMKSLGMKDAHIDEFGYVYGTLEKNTEKSIPVLGLISHMDTSDAASGKDIKPKIIKNYDGKDILLNEEKNIVMSAAEYESLADYVGKDLIVTEGTTLLGSDDKAGVAEIMTCIEEISKSKIEHGTVKVAFTPDEEIGRGADKFNVKDFGAEYAYTVDGGKLGELEYENFNAAGATVNINGINIHPGDAKNKMKNAILIGINFNSYLPENEIPSATEGYEGFQHLMSFSGSEEKAQLKYIIRDHCKEKFEAKKKLFEKAAELINMRYGEGTLELKIEDSYYNMKEKIEPYMFLIDNAKKAMENAGVIPNVTPIRGGTDGAKLSFMGLPCPNLSTGGHNFHGRFEYIPIDSMEKMTEVLVNLIKA